MIILFEEVLKLLIFTAVGFLLAKKLPIAEHSGILSTLLVYVALPCMVYRTFSAQCTLEKLSEKYMLLVVSAILIAVLSAAAFFCSKFFTKDAYKRNIYWYSLTIANYGYIGYALAGAVFGEEVLMDMMLFSLPVNVYAYTIGFSSLTGRKISLKRLITPMNVATLIGILAGLTGFTIPQWADETLASAAGCLSPLSMMLFGMTMTQFSLKKMFSDPRCYLVSACRLLVIPALLSVVLKALSLDRYVIMALLLYAMPCGMNTVVFPKLVGKECPEGASIAMISTLCALGTIPLCLTFLV